MAIVGMEARWSIMVVAFDRGSPVLGQADANELLSLANYSLSYMLINSPEML